MYGSNRVTKFTFHESLAAFRTVKHDIRPEICAINCRILGTRFWPWMDKVGWLVHEKGDVVIGVGT